MKSTHRIALAVKIHAADGAIVAMTGGIIFGTLLASLGRVAELRERWRTK